MRRDSVLSIVRESTLGNAVLLRLLIVFFQFALCKWLHQIGFRMGWGSVLQISEEVEPLYADVELTESFRQLVHLFVECLDVDGGHHLDFGA